MHSDLPLVSAIMPTRGRRQWAAEAVQMFHEQDYGYKELVVVDDIMESSFPHGLSGAGIVYRRIPRLPIGAKRNLAVGSSSGPVIMHWDSDDIYRADRIAHQVQALLTSKADIVGYNTMPFLDAETGRRYIYHGLPGYCIGVSMCYWRDAWERKQFPAINSDEDNQFQAGLKTFSCDSEGRIVARIHSGNTSDKREGISQDRKRWEPVA